MTTAHLIRSRWRTYLFGLGLGLAMCIAVVAVSGWMVRRQHQAAIDAAEINMHNLSAAVADQTDRTLTAVALAQVNLLERIARSQTGLETVDTSAYLSSRRLYNIMHDITSAMPDLIEFLLIDAQGKLLNVSAKWPAPTIDLSDRPYFQYAKAHPELVNTISRTMVSRTTGRPIFGLVHRLNGVDGTFRGVLLGAVQIDYLERLFSASTLFPGSSVALFKVDGALLARFPSMSLDAALGDPSPHRAEIYADARPYWRHEGLYEPGERLTAGSHLPHHDLGVLVSEPINSILADWRAQSIWVGVIVALGCLAAGLCGMLSVLRFRDQHRHEVLAIQHATDEERRRALQQIAAQGALFGNALDNMNEGLLMFSRANGLVLANAAIQRIFALPPDALRIGMTVSEVIAAVLGIADAAAINPVTRDFYEQMIETRLAVKFVRTLSDDRKLACNYVPHEEEACIFTFEDMTEVLLADQRIAHMAHHDGLTGLPNRDLLRTRTDEALAALQDGHAAFLCIDLDRFKIVNDTLGHPAGDTLLKSVAARIQAVIRPADVVARLGGDEFAVLLNNIDTKAEITAVADRLVAAVASPHEVGGQMVSVACSIGIAIAVDHGTDHDTLMKNADMALYRAKSDGRGRFVFFEPTMEQAVIERHRIEQDLHDAIVNGDLVLHYQPILATATREIVGFEALMRWMHPLRGMISPAEFIPIAEESGCIVQMGEWALHKACADAARWAVGVRVAVNLSPVQFRSGTLVDAVAEALIRSGLAANRLELEITESAMMQDPAATIATLGQLKALGVHIAMDDFGTGYSSLAYLQKFPFDKVKIDRSFVRDIDQTTNLAIVRAVIDIAASMGISTTAEGVETEWQFAQVAAERCREVQGFLFGKPQPVCEAMALLARQNLAVI